MWLRIVKRPSIALLVMLSLFTRGFESSVLAWEDPAHPPTSKAAPEAHPAGDKHEGAASHGEAPHGESHGIRSPLEWKTDLALWSFIVFLIFVSLLRATAWKPLMTALDQRESKIRNDIESAEANRLKAEKMLADYEKRLAQTQEEVAQILAEARRDAEHTRSQMLADAAKQIASDKDRALAEIERTRDQALEELFSHMSLTVTNATERVLGRTLNNDDQNRLIQDALQEFARK